MSYSVIQPPFTLEFHEMSREKLKEYFTWFMRVLPARRSTLQAAVQETPAFHEWQADLSPASLGPLGAWFVGQVESRPRTDDETLEIVAGLSCPIQVPPTTLTNRTLSVAMDIGMYFGETVQANVQGTKWSQELKNPSYAHHGQPVVVVQGKVPLNPVHIAVMLGFGIASGKSGAGRLRELFDIWALTLNS